ncbi:MAG: TonB-dependent receptor [Deltaproteobacteria bacterium]|nr:TonB-dependent receptor [Deltaproteobacteria bacterium]
MGGERRLLLNEWLLGFFFLCFVSMTLCISSPVFSAENEDEKKTEKKAAKEETDEFLLEEIVVTAEKREAELQKIPMDIAVVRPDEMERMNIHQMSELEKMVPDLKTNDGGGGTGFLQISIRDITTEYWNPTAETTVAVLIDGVPLTRSNAMEGKFYDLERVEMLKGPQGTLYGRGSTAGSLSMVSKKPDIGEFGGNIQLEYGSFDRKRIEGAFNIPATDKLAFRMSGRSVKRGSYDDVGLDVQSMWGMRGSMRWEPTDRQSLVVAVDTDSTDNKGGYGFQGVYFETFGDLQIVANPDPTLSSAFREYASGGTVSTPYKARWYYTEGAENEQKQKTDSWGLSATYEHELDFAYLTVQYGYRTSVSQLNWVMTQSPSLVPLGSTTSPFWLDLDTIDLETGEITLAGEGDENGYGNAAWMYTTYTAQKDPTTGENLPVTKMILYPPTYASAVATDSHSASRNYNLEARLTSQESIAAGDKTEWIAGAMLLKDDVTEIARIFENAYNEVDLREYALFGQASYAPFARLNFTGGYRYTWDNKQYLGWNGYGAGPAESSPDNNYMIRYPRELDPSKWNHYDYDSNYSTYKFNISWQATADILPYIQYSKGMKTMNVARDGRSIPPEQLNSFDAGVKTRLFNGRLQVNLSGYYYEYKNYNQWLTAYQCRIPQFDGEGDANGGLGEFTGCKQISAAGSSSLDYVENTYGPLSPGGAKQNGGNAQITWVITPADIFTLNASYSKNEYDNYNVSDAMLRAFGPLWGVGTVDGVEITNVHSALLPSNDVDRTGEEFGSRPWRGNFTYSRMWFIGTDMLTWTTSGFYEGTGLDQYIARRTDDETIFPGNPDYWTFDMSFNYSSTKWVPEGYRWTARVYGNNILDNDELASRSYNIAYNQSYSFLPNSGYITGSFLQPRTLGIQFTLNF